jgi:hypothetical protein
VAERPGIDGRFTHYRQLVTMVVADFVVLFNLAAKVREVLDAN